MSDVRQTLHASGGRRSKNPERERFEVLHDGGKMEFVARTGKTVRMVEEKGKVVFRHACLMGLEGIVSKRLGSKYRSTAPAVRREVEEDWGRSGGDENPHSLWPSH